MSPRGNGTAAPAAERSPIRLEGSHWRAIEVARNRLLVTGVLFALAFLVMAGRLVDLTVLEPQLAAADGGDANATVARRGDIVDRNGMLLATSLPVASLYADPREILDIKAAADALAGVFPDLDRQGVMARLSSDRRFVWVRRDLTPDEQDAVNRLGLPGFGFIAERERVYPLGRAAAHVLGVTDTDGRGTAGVERSLNGMLQMGERVSLSLDIRLQNILYDEISRARRRFRAVGAAGIILDAQTAEVLALVSLPDFDPNAPIADEAPGRFNRVTKGTYEMGSVFKLFTVATALDSGVASLHDSFDARTPLQVARYTIRDYHAQNRWLSVPEVLVHSSNIGVALMAQKIGPTQQRRYLDRLGLLNAASLEVPELGVASTPQKWRPINAMTVAYGHGVAVTPLQVAAAVATLVNGGEYHTPTILKRDPRAVAAPGHRVLSARTSAQMRLLMRLVVLYGTGTKADVPGYSVGGKTGTAEKANGHGYSRHRLISSFVGAFPMEAPRYVVLVSLDEPKGTKDTFNYATAGWVAAPTVARVVGRMGPLVGLAPNPQQFDVATMPGRASEEARSAAIRQAVATGGLGFASR